MCQLVGTARSGGLVGALLGEGSASFAQMALEAGMYASGFQP